MGEIIYGVRGTDGKIISIDEVPFDKPGLSCDCTCFYCHKDLQACSLNGKVSRYFRHHTETKSGISGEKRFKCNPNTANETALHQMAKQIIEEEKKIYVPPKYITPLEAGMENLPQGIIDSVPDYKFCDSRMVIAESVDLEKSVEGFIPDLAFNTNRGELFIEIYVNHKVDDIKIDKVFEYGVAMLEIDLSRYTEEAISTEDLRKIIIESENNKSWIYYPLSAKAKEEAIKHFEGVGNIKRYRKKQACNEKIKKLFEPLKYAETLNSLRSDDDFLNLYKLHRNPFWLKFDEEFEKNRQIPFWLDIPIRGEMIFRCDRRLWQSIIFNRYIYGRKNNGSSINLNDIFDKLTEDYYIDVDYDLTYRLTNPLDERTTIWLRKEVVFKYMRYLEKLGFIYSKNSNDDQNGWRSVRVVNSIEPPNQQYAKDLYSALQNVDVSSPYIDDLIDEQIIEIRKLRQEEVEKLRILKEQQEKEQQLKIAQEYPEAKVGMKVFHVRDGILEIISIKTISQKTIIKVVDSNGEVSSKTWNVLWSNNLIKFI